MCETAKLQIICGGKTGLIEQCRVIKETQPFCCIPLHQKETSSLNEPFSPLYCWEICWHHSTEWDQLPFIAGQQILNTSEIIYTTAFAIVWDPLNCLLVNYCYSATAWCSMSPFSELHNSACLWRHPVQLLLLIPLCIVSLRNMPLTGWQIFKVPLKCPAE